MDDYEDFIEENIGLELVNCTKETTIKVNTYLIVTRYLSSRTSDRRLYITLGCERGGTNKPRKKPVVDDEEKEVQVKRQGPYRTKKCGCLFKLKGEQMAMCENWCYLQIDCLGIQHATVGSGRDDPDWKLNALKTKWKSRPNFLHYLFNNWLNPFAHKFVRCWTKSHMHFGVETTNRTESEHSVLKLWLSTCYGDLDTVFLNIDSLIKGQIEDIKASLEFSKTKEKNNVKSNHIFYIDMDSEMRSYTDLLHQISTGLISKVREMHRLVKGVLNSVLPEDPGVTLTSPPETAVTKGRKKTNSKKKRQIQKSSGSGFGFGTGTGSRSWPGSGSGSGSHRRGRPPRAPRERGRGRNHGRSSLSTVINASPCSTFPCTNAFSAFIYPFISYWKNVIGDENCGNWVVADFVFGDEHQWPKVHRRMLYELEHSTNLYVNLVGSKVRVNELVHSNIGQWMNLYLNAFNLCVMPIAQLGSMTVLPLYSYLDCPGGTLVIGLLKEQRHFIQLQLNDMCPIPPLHIQWIHHRSEWVSNWTDSYQYRIADLNARVPRNIK
ncbi:hypothetical protein M9H77_17351 [Catharanthus roseus]|uniref:Uncharacterized protein n=1 Tax=Catharanthus roseus TaxID=4058 RepID=A0ACC0B4E9_CATRO|nr:hypothetical protein M9H77_17351 [Catharanthus roseus]